MNFNQEPAAWIGFIQVLIALFIGFGLSITPEQVAAIVAVVQVGSTLFVRSQVSPVGVMKGSGEHPKENGG